MRRLVAVVAFGLSLGLGSFLGYTLLRSRAPIPDPPAVVTQVREVARLETLEVTLYKKVTFSPDPREADGFWGDVSGWLRHTFAKPHGKAIVFADARLALDLARLDANAVRVTGRTVELVLPPVRATIVLRPGETEIIGSNLDSAETARLLELARAAFQREVEADRALRARARGSAERAIRGLLLGLGFTEVRFVETLPAAVAG